MRKSTSTATETAILIGIAISEIGTGLAIAIGTAGESVGSTTTYTATRAATIGVIVAGAAIGSIGCRPAIGCSTAMAVGAGTTPIATFTTKARPSNKRISMDRTTKIRMVFTTCKAADEFTIRKFKESQARKAQCNGSSYAVATG